MPEAPAPLPDLRAYGQARDALLGRIKRLLETDGRVRAAWLAGSFGRREADAWSDLDLHVAVADADFPAFLDERPALFARVGRPLLVQQEMPSDTMPGSRFQLVMYPGPVEVDWIIGPVDRAVRPRDTALLFDRVGIPVRTPPPLSPEERQAKAGEWLTFFWPMAPIAVKYAGRGESRRAASQIDLLTIATIALWRLVEQPGGPDPHMPTTNRVLELDFDARLPRLGWTIDPRAALEVIGALCAEVEHLHPVLTAFGIPIPEAMPGETAALSTMAEPVIRQGERPGRRKYR